MTGDSKRILVIDDDLSLVDLVKEILEESGFKVAFAHEAEAGLNKAVEILPDLVLLDVKLGHSSGFDVCKKIKEDSKLRHTPVIMLTGQDMPRDELAGFKAGADDYVTKPFKPSLLIARIVSAMERSARDLDANTLTYLPGNRVIMEEIRSRIEGKKKFSVLYLDLNNFKAFNDRYGFVRGDEAIKLSAEIFQKCLTQHSKTPFFLGHVGGDDFVAIVDSHDVEGLCAMIIKEFDDAILKLYDEEDRRNNKIVSIDRKGMKVEVPIMGLAIAVVTNKMKSFNHPGEISFIAGDLKKWAKVADKSNFVIDRRA